MHAHTLHTILSVSWDTIAELAYSITNLPHVSVMKVSYNIISTYGTFTEDSIYTVRVDAGTDDQS